MSVEWIQVKLFKFAHEPGAGATTIAMNVLWNLRLGVNFTNILQTAFTHADPNSTKKYNQVVSILLHFWEMCAKKLLLKSLMKLTPDFRCVRIDALDLSNISEVAEEIIGYNFSLLFTAITLKEI